VPTRGARPALTGASALRSPTARLTRRCAAGRGRCRDSVRGGRQGRDVRGGWVARGEEGVAVWRWPGGAWRVRAPAGHPSAAAWALHAAGCGAHEPRRRSHRPWYAMGTCSLREAVQCSQSRGWASRSREPPAPPLVHAQAMDAHRRQVQAPSGRQAALWMALGSPWPCAPVGIQRVFGPSKHGTHARGVLARGVEVCVIAHVAWQLERYIRLGGRKSVQRAGRRAVGLAGRGRHGLALPAWHGATSESAGLRGTAACRTALESEPRH
jgi:hypothetical protein